ncbi:hypothetical protein BJ878DRAFT_543568 [Calycina marina]|uniref:Uncharacterized protein n=1 Tax=Calycina marina TaxID=1763456 RepID=A0A9P8CDZ8_9HELO|nr:hypothetical protein BJ878DRAFT_543568 [Calycina marina]
MAKEALVSRSNAQALKFSLNKSGHQFTAGELIGHISTLLDDDDYQIPEEASTAVRTILNELYITVGDLSSSSTALMSQKEKQVEDLQEGNLLLQTDRKEYKDALQNEKVQTLVAQKLAEGKRSKSATDEGQSDPLRQIENLNDVFKDSEAKVAAETARNIRLTAELDKYRTIGASVAPKSGSEISGPDFLGLNSHIEKLEFELKNELEHLRVKDQVAIATDPEERIKHLQDLHMNQRTELEGLQIDLDDARFECNEEKKAIAEALGLKQFHKETALSTIRTLRAKPSVVEESATRDSTLQAWKTDLVWVLGLDKSDAMSFEDIKTAIGGLLRTRNNTNRWLTKSQNVLSLGGKDRRKSCAEDIYNEIRNLQNRIAVLSKNPTSSNYHQHRSGQLESELETARIAAGILGEKIAELEDNLDGLERENATLKQDIKESASKLRTAGSGKIPDKEVARLQSEIERLESLISTEKYNAQTAIQNIKEGRDEIKKELALAKKEGNELKKQLKESEARHEVQGEEEAISSDESQSSGSEYDVEGRSQTDDDDLFGGGESDNDDYDNDADIAALTVSRAHFRNRLRGLKGQTGPDVVRSRKRFRRQLRRAQKTLMDARKVYRVPDTPIKQKHPKINNKKAKKPRVRPANAPKTPPPVEVVPSTGVLPAVKPAKVQRPSCQRKSELELLQEGEREMMRMKVGPISPTSGLGKFEKTEGSENIIGRRYPAPMIGRQVGRQIAR